MVDALVQKRRGHVVDRLDVRHLTAGVARDLQGRQSTPSVGRAGAKEPERHKKETERQRDRETERQRDRESELHVRCQ